MARPAALRLLAPSGTPSSFANASLSTPSSSFATSSATSSINAVSYSAPLGTKLPPSRQKLIPTSGTYPQGFRAAGILVGVKPSNTTRPDLALLASDRPCAAAAVFTKNKFQAAPVAFSRDLLARRANDGIRAVLINSWCANAVTGRGGREDTEKMAAGADEVLLGGEGGEGSTIVMSTGVIGRRLPIDRIVDGIPRLHGALGSSHDHWLACARAICTTDTFPKLLSRTFSLPSSPSVQYRVAGMTKGAGMIHPNLATLLGVIATDAPVTPAAVPVLLRHAVDRSYNSITIDGDTSTNDTVALLANGAAGGPPVALAAGDAAPSPDFLALRDVLAAFARDLAQLVVRDGEGATKYITVRVRGAATESGARRVASAIARSPLVKTALYGRDANWGRIVCATGYALITEPNQPAGPADAAADEVRPETTSVSFVPADGSPDLLLLADGEPQPMDEARAAEILAMEDLEIEVRLGTGDAEATYWTCDYSHEYITINGDYRT